MYSLTQRYRFTSIQDVSSYCALSLTVSLDRNQFDHLLSLWRSHCSLLADLDLDTEDDLGDAVVNETTLLHEALGALHAELLEGFRQWRQRLAEELQEPLSSTSLVLGNIRWFHVPYGDWLEAESRKMAASLATKQLAEVATYLLVWGEAGNLRFMPPEGISYRLI